MIQINLQSQLDGNDFFARCGFNQKGDLLYSLFKVTKTNSEGDIMRSEEVANGICSEDRHTIKSQADFALEYEQDQKLQVELNLELINLRFKCSKRLKEIRADQELDLYYPL